MGPERTLKLGLFLSIFGLYLIVGSRERPWGDARIMYEVAEELVAHGSLQSVTEWPPMSHRGPDGRMRSIYGLFPSLAAVPGVALRNAVMALSPKLGPFATAITSHLAPTLLGAWTCLLFFGMCRRMNASVGTATLGVAVLAIATSTVIYARMPLSEAMQTTCFTGLVAELARISDEPTRPRALALGAWAGALLNTKLVFALTVAGAAVFVAYVMWQNRERAAGFIRWAVLGLLPFLALAAAYNYVRWGNPLKSGYQAENLNLNEHVWVGLQGLFFSSGKSIFLFNPPLIAAALLWPALARTRPRFAAAAALTALPTLLFCASYSYWGGDWSWGPRYISFLVPVALVPLVLALPRLLVSVRRAAVGAIALLVVGGVFVQILGSAFYWDHFMRITIQAERSWLGRPNLKGATSPERDGYCGACFEEISGYDWLPAFSPIEGHLWLLRHVPRAHDWKEAQLDAPWRRYTSLTLDIKDGYERARIDWWGLLWIKDFPEVRAAGLVSSILFLAILAAGVVMCVRALRRLR